MSKIWTLDVKPYDFRDKATAVKNLVYYLLSKTQKMFDWKNLPDAIPQRTLELYLQTYGAHATFARYNDQLYVFSSGLGGEPDVNYNPTIATVANPALNFSANLKIGEECVVIYNDSLRQGLMPLLRKYCTALVENDLTMHIYTVMSRMQTLISAGDDATKAAATKFLQDLERGNLAAIGENTFLAGVKVSPLTTSAGARITDAIEYNQYIKASLYNELGLQANWNAKRESINEAEAAMNDDVLAPFLDDMLECRQRGCEEVNRLFGTDISVELASAWKRNRIEMDLSVEALAAEVDAIDETEEVAEEVTEDEATE